MSTGYHHAFNMDLDIRKQWQLHSSVNIHFIYTYIHMYIYTKEKRYGPEMPPFMLTKMFFFTKKKR